MTLSGPEALRSIEEALRDIRREEDDALRRLARSVELAAKLKAQETELFRELAAMRLDPAARTVLGSELARVGVATTAMLAGHAEELSAAEAATAGLDASIVEASVERTRLKDEAAGRQAELGALIARARPALGKDPAYAQKLMAARELGAIAERAGAKAQQAETECEADERVFRDDPLFMYLWTRGFGTKSYRSNPLTAWLDRRLAARIDYARARTAFTLTSELPLRLREHAQRMAGRARVATAEIAALESLAVDTAGGGAAREAVTALGERIDAIDRDIVQWQDRRDEALKCERELAQGDTEAFAAALLALGSVSDGAAVQRVVSDARATPKGQDVALLGALDDLRQRATDERDEAREHRTRLKTLAARRRDLEDVQYEIKAQGFDDPGSAFEDDTLTATALNALLRGELSLAAYWERWRAAQRWAGPRPATPGRASGSGLSRPRGAVSKAESLTTAA